MLERNDLCWCGSGLKWKKCHYPKQPLALASAKQYRDRYGIILKTKEQADKIRIACSITAGILDALCRAAQKGTTTQELENLSIRLHREAKAIPACKGYGTPPFPATICTSLNEVICHGIPDDRPLQEGDIVNIDVASIVDGYFGDCSRMVMIGAVNEEKKRVVETSYECLMRAIAVCKPGVPIWEIGEAIETYAQEQKCSVVNQFVGHGTGIRFHEAPEIPHHYNNVDILMAPGMIFTIEPMINAGAREAVIDPLDRWTARTVDGRASAQWEHTLLITESGHEILTHSVK